jgi:sterol desaturase/sphingolipid hydroxylase (fatty acid hydroxylase superfamily)
VTGPPIPLFATLPVALFQAVACMETWRPARVLRARLGQRWFGNLALFALAGALAWLLPILSASGAALIAARHGWGLFHLIGMPPAVALAAGFVLLDLSAYGTHRLLHLVPALWRLHAVHHSDSDLDATTAFRHHPGEVLAQMTMDATLALLFGIPAQAILLYAGVVLSVQIFHHGNLHLPPRLRWLSRCLITPDLHRLHHSVLYAENNSNFGNLVPLWDRLFGTLRQMPEGAYQAGLAEFAGAEYQRLDKLLLQPLLVTSPAIVQMEEPASGRR